MITSPITVANKIVTKKFGKLWEFPARDTETQSVAKTLQFIFLKCSICKVWSNKGQLNEVCLCFGCGHSAVWESRLSQLDDKEGAAEEILLHDSFNSLSHVDIDVNADGNMQVHTRTYCSAFLVAQTVRDLLAIKRYRFDPWVRKIPWRREWQPTLVFLPAEFHG